VKEYLNPGSPNPLEEKNPGFFQGDGGKAIDFGALFRILFTFSYGFLLLVVLSRR